MQDQGKPIEQEEGGKDRTLMWLKLLNVFLLGLIAVGLGLCLGGIRSLYKG